MRTTAPQRMLRVTTWVTLTGVLFCLFFQMSKGGPFRDVNPLAADPYDAVGSFAIQVALLVGLLTFARALRLRAEAAQVAKTCLVLRGNALVLGAIWVTLVADAIAVCLDPLPPSPWGSLLRVELVWMSALTLASSLALALAFRRVQSPPAPRDLTPADALDDLWALVRAPVTRGAAVLPPAWVAWVQHFDSNRLFARFPWLNPRLHPWRFAAALGLLVGMGLALAQLQEGLPPSLQVGLLVTGIFVSGEFVAMLAAFALLGGFLGLRPSFYRHVRSQPQAPDET